MKTLFTYKTFVTAFVAAILSFAAQPSGAAEPWVSFRHIGIEDGLSHTTVPSIVQDTLGYIWVATHDGLNRYDGHAFKTYRSESGNPESLPDNVIKRLVCDTRGNLWILSHGNLTRYDRLLDTFEPNALPEGDATEFNAVAPLDSTRLLVGTCRALYVFDINRRRFTPLVPDLSVNALAVLADTCYVGTSRGVSYITRENQKPKALPGVSTSVNAFATDGNDLWIATEGSGVWRHSALTGRTSRFDNSAAARLCSPFVRALGTDRSGRLWIGTVDGLCVYNPATSSMRTFTATNTPGTAGATPLSHSSVRSLLADNSGGIWIGTWYGGINYYHPLQNRFRNIGMPPLNDNVVSCIVPSGHNIYIGTNAGGLNIYNTADETFSYISRAEGLRSTDVKAVYVDTAAGRLYVGTHLGGLAVFDVTSRRLLHQVDSPAKLYAILPALRDGGLWLGSLDGLFFYDIASGKARRAEAPLTNVTELYRDSHGRLWLSGESGFAICSELPDGTLRELSLPAVAQDIRYLYVNNIYEDAHTGDFCISTRRGLYVLDSSLGSVRHYTVADGLPNDVVLGVVADNRNRLWVSTSLGLAQYDSSSASFRTYGSSDFLGVRQFNAKAIASVDQGRRLYFGGVGGIITFNPDEIVADTISTAPLINGVRLFGVPVTPGAGSGIIRTTPETGTRILLQPGPSMLTLDFTAFNYHNNGNETFRYRLDGLDKDWIDAGDAHSATYRDIPPGTYRFEVQAANSDGLRSPVASIEVRVLPHWYQQWWAQLLGLIAVGLLAWLLVRRFTMRRLREQRRDYEKRDYERREELNDMKVNFFVNMSHELRTPLTLILLPVTELIEQKRNEPKVLDKLQTIRGNTMRILNIINQILDYQRAENGMFHLRVRPVDVNDMLSCELANYRSKAQHSNINCRIDSTLGTEPLPLDTTYMSIIIGNLLSNAFKHTPDGRSVKLSAALTDDNNSLVIKVSDTGYGISPDKLPHIFDRFYKVDENSYGSGIGLSLVKRLVTLHHGTISVESAPDCGTSFTITLPASIAAYASDECAASDDNTTPEAHVQYIPDSETADETAGSASEEDASADESARRTIMLVDDNDTILKYMREALASDYRIVLAHDGEEALAMVDAGETPDMIITDVMMPRTDGIRLCRAIKRNIRTSHIPVMMLSAKSDVRDQLDAMKVGADDYLPKPFSMSLLRAKIANRFRTRASAIRYYTDTTDLEPAKMSMNPLDEEFLAGALKAVETHLDDSEFTTDAFAREMLMSRSNLHLKLKALTGESANEFIRRIRMNRALELLKSGRYTVAEVSTMVGYGTPSYFSTSFKKFFGSQPSDYTKI